MIYFLINITIFIILYIANSIMNRDIIKKREGNILINRIKLIGLIFVNNVDLNNMYIRNMYSKMIKLYGKQEAFINAKIHLSENFLIIMFANIIISIIQLKQEIDLSFLAISILSTVFVLFIHYKEINKKVITRNNMLKLQFPILANSLLLLIQAGLDPLESWKQVCYSNRNKNMIFIEANKTVELLNCGLNKEEAFKWFTGRCEISEISRFITVFLYCIKNGTDELNHLRLLVDESWEMKKQTVRYSGEKTATKMMLPISMMFISTIILVATPGIILLLKN